LRTDADLPARPTSSRHPAVWPGRCGGGGFDDSRASGARAERRRDGARTYTRTSIASRERDKDLMALQEQTGIDNVTLSVINNAFVTICREMGTAMMRTSYSPIFNEGLDFSCMIFNRQGDLIGQAEF